MSQLSPSPIPLWAGSLAHTPIGPISVVVSECGLRQVSFAPVSQIAAEHAGQWGSAQTAPDSLAITLQEIESYLGGCCRLFTAPLDFSGMSRFQEDVLHATLAVAFGETRTWATTLSPWSCRAIASSIRKGICTATLRRAGLRPRPGCCSWKGILLPVYDWLKFKPTLPGEALPTALPGSRLENKNNE